MKRISILLLSGICLNLIAQDEVLNLSTESYLSIRYEVDSLKYFTLTLQSRSVAENRNNLANDGILSNISRVKNSLRYQSIVNEHWEYFGEIGQIRNKQIFKANTFFLGSFSTLITIGGIHRGYIGKYEIGEQAAFTYLRNHVDDGVSFEGDHPNILRAGIRFWLSREFEIKKKPFKVAFNAAFYQHNFIADGSLSILQLSREEESRLRTLTLSRLSLDVYYQILDKLQIHVYALREARYFKTANQNPELNVFVPFAGIGIVYNLN